jgi:hypothetical protein
MTTYYLQPDSGVIALRPGSKNSDEFFSCFGSDDHQHLPTGDALAQEGGNISHKKMFSPEHIFFKNNPGDTSHLTPYITLRIRLFLRVLVHHRDSLNSGRVLMSMASFSLSSR